MKKCLSILMALVMLFTAVPVLAIEESNVTDCTTEGGLNFQERTEAYKTAMEYYDRMGSYGLNHKTETDYGTLVEYSVSRVTYITVNHISYIRYDGEQISVSQYAPNRDEENKMKYEKLEISSDGKIATITYPELKNTGTFVITVDLVNCTAKRDIIPYVKKEEPEKEPAEEITEPAVGGLCEGYFWVDEDTRPEATVRWEYSGGTLTISGTGDMHDFYFTWGGRVQHTTTIGKPWKEYYDKIKKVVIEEGVNSISRYAFVDCTNLEEVVIGDNVTIKTEAFKNLRNLEKITLGKNCTLGERAFINCTALQSVILTDGVVVNTGVFDSCYALDEINFEGPGISVSHYSFLHTPFYEKTDMVYVNNELLWMKNALELESFIIPEGTTRIGGFLFQYGKLKEITLPESMVEIGESAFRSSKLTKVSLNEGLKKIDEAAFSGSKLTEASLPERLEYIGKKAFRYTNITEVRINKNLTIEDGDPNDGGAFSDCDNLQYVTIEDGVQKIADGMFAECSKLESIVLPDSVKVIGNGAFKECYKLSGNPIGKGVEKIGNNAFESCNNILTADISHIEDVGEGVFKYCKSLEKVILNENMTKIPHSFFDGCIALCEVILPPNITSIENYAFRNTQSLTGEFKMPETVTNVGEWAFEGSGFSSVIVPDGVTEIGIGAFKNMKNLTKMSLPEGITKISPKAFEGSSNITEVIIPSTVNEIGYEAFNNCESLNKITIPENVSKIGYNAFSDCSKLESVTLPKNVTDIPAGLFKNCVSLKNAVVASENIISIGNEAFSGCSSLNEINLPDTVEVVGGYIFTNSGIYENPTYWEGGAMYVSNCVVAAKEGMACVKIKEGTIAIAPGAFENCNISEIHIPGSVKTIASSAFSRCGTKKFVLNEGIETIKGYAFSYCGVEEINLPDSLLLIESSAFSGCDKIKELVIPAKVDIRGTAFESFDSQLEKVTFKEGREEIDMYSRFGYHPKIKEVVLPDGLKKIDDSSFSNWENLEKIKIPDTVEEIGERAFSNCNRLTSISIPNVKVIGKEAFEGCDRLEKVTLGLNAEVADDAFVECPMLMNPVANN
ncbi:MAG: leucine-rich repeat domain-containing protein [Clostridia bacterium]|nr:leucine-rich repeat domain-containing protein [Clostridia bacterium]